jgi:hypothetical protein
MKIEVMNNIYNISMLINNSKYFEIYTFTKASYLCYLCYLLVKIITEKID